MKQRFIIYAPQKDNNGVVEKIGVAHYFEGRLWWETARYELDEEGHAGPLEPTISRLLRTSDPPPEEIVNPEIRSLVRPPYDCGIPTRVIIVTQEE